MIALVILAAMVFVMLVLVPSHVVLDFMTDRFYLWYLARRRRAYYSLGGPR